MRKTGINWQLTEEEIAALRLEWTRRSIKNVDQIEARFHSRDGRPD